MEIVGKEPKTLLEVRNLHHSYGAAEVLAGVSFKVRAGEIVGLVGENGAGKSTLVKCVLRLVRPTGGEVVLAGRASAIHQEFNLAPALTVAENIFLGREIRRGGLLDRRLMRREASRMLAMLGSSIDPDTPVEELPVAGRQMVEIARAIGFQANILIMDEPSTLLNGEETARLFEIMRKFASDGGAVVYISHKLEEVREICRTIHILRDGVLVASAPSSELSAAEIAEKMVGRELTRMFPEKLPPPTGEPVLEVEHLASGRMVRDVSFELRRGEILGVAGLAGAGRSEMAEAIMALRCLDFGTVKLRGAACKFRSPREALASGLSMLTEDRQASGLLVEFSISENVALASLAKYVKFGFIRRRAVENSAQSYVEKFGIRCASTADEVRKLSGGNQQKVAIAKGLDTSPRIFIFDEPTRGVDVAARREIYEFIHELAASGAACLMICSDLEELLGMCRRVMVMREGRTVGFVEGKSLNERSIILLATGVDR